MQKVMLPFIAGLLAVLFFQESTLALLHAAGISALEAFDTTPVPPLDAPSFVLTALAGGLGGVLMVWLFRIAPDRPAPWVGALAYGAIGLTAAAIFALSPLQGVWPSGNLLPRIGLGLLTNAAWGWGTLIFIRAFSAGLNVD